MEMISKKELLALTGISYGQLYRWKRERLIPEEWFVKQSSFTGQETFFPREPVLERIRAILAMKGEHSLGELAHILDTEPEGDFSLSLLMQEGGLEPFLARRIEGLYSGQPLCAGQAALLVALSRKWPLSGTTEKDWDPFLRRTLPLLGDRVPGDLFCLIFRSGGSLHPCLFFGEQPRFDPEIEILTVLSLGETVHGLKKLKGDN